jgi:hypothetical protein
MCSEFRSGFDHLNGLKAVGSLCHRLLPGTKTTHALASRICKHRNLSHGLLNLGHMHETGRFATSSAVITLSEHTKACDKKMSGGV